MINYAIYLKPTNACNKRCWFCYDPHIKDGECLKDPSKAFNVINDKVLSYISSPSGNNIQFIMHGGEFLLVGEKWLEIFLNLLKNKYSNIQLCGMSNLSSSNFRKCYEIFRKYGGNIGTSYNSEVFSEIWVDNLNYVLKRQNNTNLNKVYLGENIDFDELLKEIKNFTKYDNWTFKFERAVNTDVEDIYFKSSIMIIEFLKWCFKQNHNTLKHFGIFLFCILKLEIDRRMRLKKTENYGINLCDPRCCISHFVIDNKLNVGKCTKFYKDSLKLNLQHYKNIIELMNSTEYAEFNKKLFTKKCQKTQCAIYDICVGSCKLNETLFDSRSECNNNSLVYEWLKTISDFQLNELIDNVYALKTYCLTLKKTKIF